MDKFGGHTKRNNSFTDPTNVNQYDLLSPQASWSPFVGIKLRKRTASSRASSEESSGDTPLYMATKSHRRGHLSLSTISNWPSQSFNHQAEPVLYSNGNSLGENTTWKIIEPEISEWQNTYETERPGWCLPASYWNRVCISTSKWSHGNNTSPPGPLSNSREHLTVRRPEHLRPAETFGSVELLGSQLISSPRMHTGSRYTSVMGQQAKNACHPTIWHGSLDGAPLADSPDESSGGSFQNNDLQSRLRKRKSHPPLVVTEISVKGIHTRMHSEQQEANQCELSHASNTKRGRHGLGKIILPKRDKFLMSRCQDAHKQLQTATICLKPSSETCNQLNKAVPLVASEEGFHSSFPHRGIIRSEAYPFFVQPVREMIVKHWQLIRRRLRHGFSHGYPNPGYRDSEVAVSIPNSQLSQTVSLRVSLDDGNPSYSSDGKERRRRARERGDIHSSSAESNPCYNTPTGLSPTSPARLGHPTRYRYADLLRAAATIASACKSEEGTNLSVATNVSSSGAKLSRTASNEKGAIHSSMDPQPLAKQDNGQLSPPVSATGKHISQSRHRRRQGSRRSYLSEVYTPDEYEERNLLSALGSAMASPNETEGEYEATAQPGGEYCKLHASQADDLQKLGITPLKEILSAGQRAQNSGRPRIYRINSSGTQRFTPSEDGVEVGGLPTGGWDQDGNGNGRRTRSFL